MKNFSLSKKQKRNLTRIVVALILFFAVFIPDKLAGVVPGMAPLGEVFDGPAAWVFPFCLYLVVYLLIGYDVLWRAVRNIAHGQVFDENFLMCVATLGAFALAIYRGATGQEIEGFDEACAVLLFYQVGEFFQDYATSRSRKSSPASWISVPTMQSAARRQGGKGGPGRGRRGGRHRRQSGRKGPSGRRHRQGCLCAGYPRTDGESLPREVQEGGEVISGCVNITSRIEVRVTKLFYDSTVSKILELVETASEQKSKQRTSSPSSPSTIRRPSSSWQRCSPWCRG